MFRFQSAAGHALLRICSLALGLSALGRADETVAASKSDPAEHAAQPAGIATPLEAQCTDGSVVKLALLDERLRFKTRYGELVIPAADVLRIEFATRMTDDVARRIDAPIV